MEKKDYCIRIEKIKKSSEKSMYIFFNVQKGIGIKRMRPLFDDPNMIVGEYVMINGEKHILDCIFDFQNGQLISWIGE